MMKTIKVDDQTHSDVADMASILNLSREAKNATLGDAVRIAVSEWLDKNRVIVEKQRQNEKPEVEAQ